MKDTVAIQGHKGLKLVQNVLYVPKVAKNLFSVSQLLDNGYKVLFKGKYCTITDVEGKEAFKIMKKDKSFALNPLEKEEPSDKDLSSKSAYTTSAEYQEYSPSTKKGIHMEVNNRGPTQKMERVKLQPQSQGRDCWHLMPLQLQQTEGLQTHVMEDHVRKEPIYAPKVYDQVLCFRYLVPNQ